MTREQVNNSNTTGFSQGFQREDFLRLASLFFLMLIYPLLAMLFIHTI
jgi:hypothetical protein